MEPCEKLNVELIRLLEWLSLSDTEIQIRKKIKEEIGNLVISADHSCKASMLGSFVSGM